MYHQLFSCVSSLFLFGQDALSRLSVAYTLRSLALAWSFEKRPRISVGRPVIPERLKQAIFTAMQAKAAPP